MANVKRKLKTKNKMFMVLGCALVIIILVLTIGFKVKNYTEDRPYYFGVTDDISIRYAYSIGVPTIDTRNKQEDYMDVLTIKLEGENLKKMKKLLKTYTFHLDDKKEAVGVAGEYELLIGDEIVFIDQDGAIYTKDSKKFYLIDVTFELYDLVSDITWEVLEKNFTPLSANEITVSNNEKTTTFNDKARVDELCSYFRFHELKAEEDEGVLSYRLDFHNGKVITIYDSNIGTYEENGNKKWIIFYTDPRENIRNLFETKVLEDEEAEYNAMNGQ